MDLSIDAIMNQIVQQVVLLILRTQTDGTDEEKRKLRDVRRLKPPMRKKNSKSLSTHKTRKTGTSFSRRWRGSVKDWESLTDLLDFVRLFACIDPGINE